MKPCEVEKLFNGIPRERVLFLPTPFHKLNNLSKKYDVDLYIKREDFTGPSLFGGNKTRKLEFILGEALKEGVEYMISIGGYQTNSAMEMVQFCNLRGIKPIVFLGDVIDQGTPEEYRGNLLLMQMMGAEIHYVFRDKTVKGSFLVPMWNKMMELSLERKAELEKQGHKAMVIPSGCVHPIGWIAYVLTFKEIVEQSEALGVDLDYIVHTTGTGGSLPGLIAGKLLLGSKIKILSMAINHYGPGEICSIEEICNRVKHVFKVLQVQPPSDEAILKEINIDEAYMGEDYGVPTLEGTAAIDEMARNEVIFLDAVYTGKGFSGLLDYVRNGKIPKGSRVAFIHTGGTGAIFAESKLTGKLAKA